MITKEDIQKITAEAVRRLKSEEQTRAIAEEKKISREAKKLALEILGTALSKIKKSAEKGESSCVLHVGFVGIKHYKILELATKIICQELESRGFPSKTVINPNDYYSESRVETDGDGYPRTVDHSVEAASYGVFVKW